MKLSMSYLRSCWEKEGTWGAWRDRLKEGYLNGERYFEFGLIPDFKGIDVKIIVNHFFHINLKSGGEEIPDITLLRSDSDEIKVIDNAKIKSFYIPEKLFDQMKKEAINIFEEYKDDEIICFWSIPNKWFSQTKLISFIEDNVASIIPSSWPRQDFYWP